MTLLSDSEIRELITEDAKSLIVGGDKDLAKECSYSFLSGKAFLAGSDQKPITFPGEGESAEVIVQPGQMVWIRVRNRVQLPNNIVGFWWQTNTLSRKGLMLVNMSMVEPGYCGELACLFVNFGKTAVVIDAKTVVAKMVFMKLAGTVAQPLGTGRTREDYDSGLRDLAIAQPHSFLQIGELATTLSAARDEAIDQIKKEAEASRKTAAEGFKEDVPKAIRAAWYWAVGALAILTMATVLADWIEGKVFPDVKTTATAAADAALTNRLSLGVQPRAEDKKLDDHFQQLEKRLKTLEAKK